MSNKPALRDHRIRIMEGVLAWEGEIGNSRVRQLFGLQLVQASRLMADFRAAMGNRIIEDTRARVIRPASESGLATDITLDTYLRHIQWSADETSVIVDARADLTEVRPHIFAALRKATIAGSGISISYASMSNPAFRERTIYPHSIVHVGRRWHVRAWCASRKEFRDFTLGRIRDAAPTDRKSDHGVEDDVAWNTQVQIVLRAHRALTREQAEVVQRECFANTESRILTTRGCLVQYVIQDIRAALDPDNERPPEFQIEVMNQDDLKPWLF